MLGRLPRQGMFTFRPPNAAEFYTCILLFHQDTDTTHKHSLTYSLMRTLSVPLYPPTSTWHTSKAPPGRLEEREAPPRKACWQPSVSTAWRSCTARTPSLTGQKPKPVSLDSRKSKKATTALTLGFQLWHNLNHVLFFWESIFWFTMKCDLKQLQKPLGQWSGLF